MKKRILSVLMCVAMVGTMAMAGCGKKEEAKKEETKETTSETADKTDGEELTVELVAKGFQHDFWKAVKKGSDQAAKELGVKVNFVGPKDESAIAEQTEQLNNAINKAPSAICLAALDPDAVTGALETAKSKKIPVVGFDSGVPGSDSVVANAATDNKNAGALAAENLYEAIKDKVTDPAKTVRIGVVSQDATSQSVGERTSGFIDKMVELIGADKTSVTGHDKYTKEVKDAKVVIEVGIPATTDDAACVTVANTLLNKDDLIAIYGSNEFSAKNIITADESLNKLGSDKIVAVGFDAGKVQLDAVKSGKFLGSITQDPVQIGYKAVELAVKAAKGEDVEDVDTGCHFYDKDNMEDAEIKACLYE